MRPINLKIKGLNSFIETQEINFEKLTEKGLFGIFGPTGSGKSTVLDGITLALYGEVARKSTNYMNTNCESLNVSYEFQITEKHIRRYRVDREFRRDNKTGSVRSKSAKVMDVTDGNELILEEGVKQVTQKCEEIIGLKLEDFTRTVVLPQGKFSEFLKLEGKDRRNMLERLFNLQKYGDDLSFKLGNKIKLEKQKSDLLEGELRNYEEISDDILKDKKTSLKKIKEQCQICRNEFNTAEKNFNEGKELWDLQVELKEKLEIQNQLKENEDSINKIKKRVKLGTSVLKVKPYIDSYENTIHQIDAVNTELAALRKNADTIKIEKEKNIKFLEITQNKKENEIPTLKIKVQRVIDAFEEKISLNKLIKENNILIWEIDKLNGKQKDANNKLNVYDNNINLLKTTVNDFENKIGSLKVDEEYKKKINDGIILLNNYESIKKQKQNLNKEIDIAKITIDEAQKESELFSKNLNIVEDTLHKKEDELKVLIENCPGDQNTLLNLQQHITNIREKWNKYNEYSLSINKSNEILVKINKELQVYEEEKQKLEDNISSINDKIKKIETENIAMTLRQSLVEGETCPVCGSNYHQIDNIEVIDLTNLDELKLELKTKEIKNNNLNIKINKLQANVETETANIKDKEEKLKELGGEFKSHSVEELKTNFEKLKNNINNYNEGKAKLEKDIKELNEKKSIINIDYNKVNTKLVHTREYLKKLNNDLNIKTEEFNKIYIELSALKVELSIEDFKSKSEEIFNREKEKALLEIEIKKKRENLIKAQELKEEINKVIIFLNEELKVKNTTVAEKNINIEEKKTSIKNKVGNEEDLESLKDSIIHAIKKIEDEYEAVYNHNKEIEKQFNECNDRIISFQGNLNSLSNRLINDKESLETVLTEEGIKNIKEAKDYFISKVEIDKMLLQIEEYQAELTKLSGAIENLISKINNRRLTEEEWFNIQNIKSEKSKILEALKEESIKLEEEVKAIGERLIYKNELLVKKEELDHKLSMLVDLEKLFKGKKFVEFVATNQLKYVSIEACKKLIEITGGQYGLEVDENGKFLIRDYKNGGAQRDASTLSGGETFVASLSLALALSAQIQLKGTAPLELFFLDEGFGTLDDNLMEVVMDSLEKINNNRFSIGIISHVESIKNRVPVKLIVTPAISGMGGSKVRIERN